MSPSEFWSLSPWEFWLEFDLRADNARKTRAARGETAVADAQAKARAIHKAKKEAKAKEAAE